MKRTVTRQGESRAGSVRRRWLEFDCVRRAVKRDKERFAARLTRNIPEASTGPLNCFPYKTSLDKGGYPSINFRHPLAGVVKISAPRVFAILRNAAPIPLGMDVAHTHGCVDRRCVRHIELQHYTVNAPVRVEPEQ